MKLFLNTKDEEFVENSFKVSVLQAYLDSDSDFEPRFDLGSTRFLNDGNEKEEEGPSSKTIIQYVAIAIITVISVLSVIAAFINLNIKNNYFDNLYSTKTFMYIH